MANPVKTVPVGDPTFAQSARVPGLLLAWAPTGASEVDRMPIGLAIEIGRTGDGWAIADEQMSGRHLSVRVLGEQAVVEDLGSTNGTHVDGSKLDRGAPLAWGGVVRAGRCLFVAHPDLESLGGSERMPPGMAGRFHGPALVRALEIAALTGRHTLVAGDSGTGKELCARWLAGERPLVSHNCARFTSGEEAEATLFGVARGVFSGVDPRPGLLERAAGGVLFLDELHVLPLRVQQSLLRFVEDGLHSRIGASDSRPLDVQLVFGTNVAVDGPDIAPDLVARLHVVAVPSLAERRADVPEIFLHALRRAAESRGAGWASALLTAFGADHAEALCLADWTGRNVRGLEDIAAEVVARTIAAGGDAESALREVFGARFGESLVARRRAPAAARPASPYEANRERIVAVYWSTGKNLSETERVLRTEGITLNRKWLAEYLRRWGLR